MSLLEVADVKFGYTNQSLFTGVTFHLEAGERAALVAPNGAGKSTLLRLLAAELKPDFGCIVIRKGARLGYYRQSHEFTASGTLLDALLSGFGELLALRHQLREAQHAAATGERAALERLAAITDRYHLAQADALEHRVETLATRLGFKRSELERPVSTLSGGERGRLSLGVVLAQEPELLLLDEPTNHLDLETIDWLESHLSGSKAALLVVSHDRAFLDAVCPITLELGRSALRVYSLPYTEYHAARELDLERERKLVEEQGAFVAKTEDFIRRNLAGQKTKQAQSRRKMLDKLTRLERPEDIWARAERVRFRFAEAPRSGDIVLDAKGLFAERGGVTLFQGVDLLIRRGDRIGIVGPNGAGKSTLLRLLAERGTSEDRGEVRRGTNLREGFFDQHLGSLDPEKTGVQEVRSVRGDLNQDGARQYLARFRFWGDDPLRRVESLSGGERTRLALAKLLLEPRNLLFLDEPTNHLDIPAAEILEEALTGFEGTVLLVSHDRRFLENVTTRTLCFRPEGVDVYDGGFKDYCEAKLRQEKALEQPPASPPPRHAGTSRVETAPATQGADAHKARRAEVRELERRQKRVRQLEGEIQQIEASLEAYRKNLRDGAESDWEKLHEWATKERELTRKLETMWSQWLTLSEQLAAIEGSKGAQE